jgi:hypothetical protein
MGLVDVSFRRGLSDWSELMTRTNLDIIVSATENISAAFRQMGDVVTSYTEAMRPIVQACDNWRARMRDIFPAVEEESNDNERQ